MGYRHVMAAIELGAVHEPILRAARHVSEINASVLSVVSVVPAVSQFFKGFDMTLESGFESKLKAAAITELKQILRRVRIPEERARLLMGTPSAALAKFAEQQSADLMVVGTHNRHGVEYFMGTTATAILQRCHCDVLGVRGTRNQSPKTFGKVLVAVSGNEDTDAILKRTFQVAGRAQIQVLTVIEPLFSRHGLTREHSGTLKGISKELEADLVASMKEKVAAHKMRATVECLHGTASAAIKQRAQDYDADLLVMGSGRHVGFGWMIGSTTNNVLHGALCDTLVVRTTTSG